MRAKILILLVCFAFSFNSYAKSFDDPSSWSDPEVVRLLKDSTVLKLEPMKEALEKMGKVADFYGDVFLVTLEGGLKAVFKTLPMSDVGCLMSEVASYRASVHLGFPLIPPTTLRTINGTTGSMQLFVDTSIDLLSSGNYQIYLSRADKDQSDGLRIFYFVFGQWDSGPHNLLIYPYIGKLHLVAIDNMGICNRQYVKNYGDIPFVRVLYSDKFNTDDWASPFPFDEAKTIENFSLAKLKETFGDKIPESFYENFKFQSEILTYVIYKNSLWIKYHDQDPNFIKPYTERCSKHLIDPLRKLDLPLLKDIFASDLKLEFLTDDYLKAILERRDQVLNFCDKNS